MVTRQALLSAGGGVELNSHPLPQSVQKGCAPEEQGKAGGVGDGRGRDLEVLQFSSGPVA